MIGYGLLQGLVLLRLLPWIMQEPFAPSYWAFTFGATALATAQLGLLGHGEGGAIGVVAPIVFILANLVVILVAAGTVRRAAQGRLIAAPIAVQLASLQKRSAA
jgi:tellurite resistance protein